MGTADAARTTHADDEELMSIVKSSAEDMNLMVTFLFHYHYQSIKSITPFNFGS